MGDSFKYTFCSSTDVQSSTGLSEDEVIDEPFPLDNILSLDPPPKLSAFGGNGNVSFSVWLRKFENYADIHAKPWTDAEKAKNFKIFPK